MRIEIHAYKHSEDTMRLVIRNTEFNENIIEGYVRKNDISRLLDVF